MQNKNELLVISSCYFDDRTFNVIAFALTYTISQPTILRAQCLQLCWQLFLVVFELSPLNFVHAEI